MKLDRFAGFAWGVLALNLFVIAWGALVRATGSGAGCGSHWPLCNGDVVPRSAQIATMIEYTHRVTSGLALVAVAVLFVWALREFPPKHRVRMGAAFSLGFILLEALLGAGLVLFELVADDASSFRAVSTIAHLINTFILVAVLSLTAWWASGGPPIRPREHSRATRLLAPAFVGLLLVAAMGAIAALGDTLFPTENLREGLRESFSADAHPLIQLRKYHPLLAILVGLYVVGVARYLGRFTRSIAARGLGRALVALYIAQIVAGVTNIVLLAPVPMQLIHLLLADTVWIVLVLFAAATLAGRSDVVDRALSGDVALATGGAGDR